MDIYLTMEILRRLGFAAFCGACVGFERDVHGRAAGLRTHTLVASGAALFTMVSMLCAGCPLEFTGHEALHGDVCRIAAQVVSGIGFLGAGTIIKTGFTVKGLTTAACLWFAAALGMTCAINMITAALLATSGSLLIVFIGKQIERKLHRLFPFQLIVEATDYETITKIQAKIMSRKDYDITTLNISTSNDPKIVKAFFYIDANCPSEQVNECLSLTQEISEKFPNVVSVAYKSEG